MTYICLFVSFMIRVTVQAMPTPWRYRGKPAVAYNPFSSGLHRSSDRDREEVYEQGSPRENVCLRMPYSCAVNQVDSSMFGVVDSRSPNDCPHKACKGVVVEYQTEQYTEGGCVVLHTQDTCVFGLFGDEGIAENSDWA
jgi:hypothetical protein